MIKVVRFNWNDVADFMKLLRYNHIFIFFFFRTIITKIRTKWAGIKEKVRCGNEEKRKKTERDTTKRKLETKILNEF